MVKQKWSCSECDKVYSSEKEALECEQKHEIENQEAEKIRKENAKMVFDKVVKVTKSNFDTTGGNVDFQVPKGCDLIILMGNRGGGFVPYQCLLPHQVYVNDLRKAFKEHGFEVIYVIGVKSKDTFPIVYANAYGFGRWKQK